MIGIEDAYLPAYASKHGCRKDTRQRQVVIEQLAGNVGMIWSE